jgi:hypothetical protein
MFGNLVTDILEQKSKFELSALDRVRGEIDETKAREQISALQAKAHLDRSEFLFLRLLEGIDSGQVRKWVSVLSNMSMQPVTLEAILQEWHAFHGSEVYDDHRNLLLSFAGDPRHGTPRFGDTRFPVPLVDLHQAFRGALGVDEHAARLFLHAAVLGTQQGQPTQIEHQGQRGPIDPVDDVWRRGQAVLPTQADRVRFIQRMRAAQSAGH